ncbi:MAG: hypothetical protein RL318_1648 [Fibrobacterota bacterium]
MGRNHLKAIGNSSQFHCVGICDLNESFDGPQDLPRWQDLDQALLESQARAVVLAAPPDAHASLAETCLHHGLPVLLEKPLTPEFSRSLHLAQAFQGKGIPLFPAMVERCNPAWRLALTHWKSLGTVHRIVINRSGTSARPEHQTDVGHDLAIHDLDLLAQANPHLKPTLHEASPTRLQMRLQDHQGCTVHLEAEWDAASPQREWLVEGDRGRMRIDFQHRALVMNGQQIPVPKRDALESQLADFAATLTSRTQVDLGAALQAQAWLEAPIHATASISTFTSRGRRPTSMVERAGA